MFLFDMCARVCSLRAADNTNDVNDDSLQSRLSDRETERPRGRETEIQKDTETHTPYAFDKKTPNFAQGLDFLTFPGGYIYSFA